MEPTAQDDSGDAPTTLASLDDDVLEHVGACVVEDLCCGAASLVMLSRASKHFRGSSAFRRPRRRTCAAKHGVSVAHCESHAKTLELLSIIEAVIGLGTNRIYFQRRAKALLSTDAKPQVRPGSSGCRLLEFALLLRRHPRLTLKVEGHESSAEGEVFEFDNHGVWNSIRASSGVSKARAEAVREALRTWSLEKVDRHGTKQWGRMPSSRFEPRIACRDWGTPSSPSLVGREASRRAMQSVSSVSEASRSPAARHIMLMRPMR